MPKKQSENVALTFTDKVIEGAKAIPAQVRKLAASVLGQDEGKRPPKTAPKARKTPAKPRKTVKKSRKAATKK